MSAAASKACGAKWSGTPCWALIPADLRFRKTKLKRDPSRVAGSNLDGRLFQEDSGEAKRLLLIGGSGRAGISGVLLSTAGEAAN